MDKHRTSYFMYIVVFIILATPLFAQETDESREIALINGLIADHMYEQAAMRINTFLQDHPVSPNREILVYQLGEIYFRTDDYQKARQTLEQFLSTFTASQNAEQARYLLASTCQFLGDYNSAKQYLGELLASRELDDEMRHAVLQRRASVHLLLGEQRSAKRDLEEALDMRAELADRIRLAHLNFEIGELGDARRQYERILEQGLSDPEDLKKVVMRLALVYYQHKDYQDVITFLTPRIEQYNDNEIIVGTLAWAYYQSGSFKEAYDIYAGRQLSSQTVFENKLNAAKQLLLISEYRAAIRSLKTLEQEATDTDQRQQALTVLAEAYEHLGDYKSAVATLELLTPLVGSEERAFNLYTKTGDLYLDKLGNPSAAITPYVSALSIDENREEAGEVKARLIDAYLAKGDKSSALNRMLDFIDKHEDNRHFESVLFKAGQLYQATGSYDLALEQYRKIAQLRSKSPFRQSSYAAAFELVVDLQKWREIITIGNEYLREFPKSEQAFEIKKEIGQAHYLLGEFADGITVFEQCLTSNADSKGIPYILSKLAWGYYKQGELELAQRYYQQIYDEHQNSPQFEQALYWLGWLANVNNDLAVANSRFDTLVKNYPDSRYAEIALFQLGSNAERAGASERAIDYFSTLIEQYPNGDYLGQARNKLVELAKAQGNYKAAVLALPRFEAENPVNHASADNLFEYGNKLAEQGKYKDAIEVFERIKQRFPASDIADEVLFNLANLHMRDDHYRNAARELNALIINFEQSDKLISAHYLLGQTLLKMRNFTEAAVHFKTVLAVNNDQKAQETINYLLGTCYEQSGDLARATEHYNRYLKNLADQKSMLPRRLEIATMLLGQKRYQDCIDELTRIIAATADDQLEMNAQYLIGQSYEEWGQLEKAAAEYLKVTYAHNSAPAGALMARMRAAKIYEQLDRYEEASAIYQGLIRNHAGSRFAEVAKIRLEVMESNVQPDQATDQKQQ